VPAFGDDDTAGFDVRPFRMVDESRWAELFDAIQHSILEELPTFGHRRSLGGGARLVPVDEPPVDNAELLNLLLLLLYWQERFRGDEPWNYDDLQALAEQLDSHASEWAESRPATSAAMRSFTKVAWTVL
jgi:hypothetical protein